MRALVLSLFLALPTLSFSAEAFLARLGNAPEKSDWSVEVGLRQFTRSYWLDAEMRPAGPDDSKIIKELDGTTLNAKSVKGFRFEFNLAYAINPRNHFEISLPYYNQELSPGAVQFVPSPLNDTRVRRADGSGDISAAWRGALLGQAGDRFRAGMALELSVPTGQGPFTSAHPLVATGNGGFVGTAAAHLRTDGEAWHAWLQAKYPYEFGYSADIAPGTFVSFQTGSGLQTLPGGRSWVSRAPSYSAVLGLGWDWYISDEARHRIGVECQYERRGAMLLDGAELPNSAGMAFNIVPELRFEFGKRIGLNAGWISPFGAAANQAVAYWGELLFRVDYAL